MEREINKIAVIGAGLVGSAWAAFYAGKGFAVNLYDVDKAITAKGYQKALESLKFLLEHNLITQDAYKRANSSLDRVESIQEAVKTADFVQESASERYEIKKKIFAEIDGYTPEDVIIASSTSALLMTEIQKVMKHPERGIIAHPFNPAHLVPLVELVGGEQTSEAVITRLYDFFEDCGKVAVIIKKEIPGFIANRLQAAVWREAIDMVLNGVASVGDVDKALYAGPGIRWALMGQHMTFHLGGGPGGIEHFVDHIGENKRRLWEDMAKWTQLPCETKKVLSKGIEQEMGERSFKEVEQWRDEKLVKLLKVIYQS
jgi:3-hydroxyacyl-CoA dehydrogenase